MAGAGGMLGHALQRALTVRGACFVAPGERDFDITDSDVVRRRVKEFAATLASGQTGALLNAAAYTNVEQAEDEPEIACRVNEEGPRILAQAARDAGLAFVHVSTDFVFDGTKRGAYTESDQPNPLSVYGASKLAGEAAVMDADPDALVVRTAWAFGEHGVSFPAKIINAARMRPTISVVTDEIGSPTYTADLAAGILSLLDAGATGLFHLAGSGSCNRFDLARETLDLAGLGSVELEPVTSDCFPSKAARPMNSVLDCSKAAALGVVMPDWRDALARFIAVRGL